VLLYVVIAEGETMSHECPGDQFEQEASQARLCSTGCGFFA
jgi:hypothetical protein